MTLQMPDSVNVSNLPAGYPAYLGYADGKFANGAQLRARFPAAELVLLTVTGETTAAHGARVSGGADAEPGNLTAAGAVWWAMSNKLGEFPVIYASVTGEPGYGMADVLAELDAIGTGRDEVRLLSAHYGDGPHICGPRSCGLIGTEMDGTQWTDEAPAVNGHLVDMSVLRNDFFSLPQGDSETETLVTELGTVQQGDTGTAVETVQGLLLARGQRVTLDGEFGPLTASAVRVRQIQSRLTADGIVGPQTWPVLLGVA
jgi:Putative peptidoglycan binding domain